MSFILTAAIGGGDLEGINVINVVGDGGNTCGVGTGDGKVFFGIACSMEGIGPSVLSLTIPSSKAWICGFFGNSLLSTELWGGTSKRGISTDLGRFCPRESILSALKSNCCVGPDVDRQVFLWRQSDR